jgi:hypothetical protein
LLGLSTAGSLAGCTVASCPPDMQCRPLNDNGTGGSASGAGGRGAGGGSNDTGGSSGSGGSTEADAGPPPPGEWVEVTANLIGMASVCGTVSGAWAKPDEDMLITSVASAGLWTSRDGGSSWQKIGIGKGSDDVNNGGVGITFDPDHPSTYWENGIHNSIGVFKTTDDGKTFTLQNVAQSDSLGIDFTDPDRKTLLSGTHETRNQLFLSVDSGAHYTDIGANLPDGNCTRSFVIDSQTFLLGCTGYGGGVVGIIRSTDAGKTWDQVSKSGGGGSPLRATDNSLYWTNATAPGMAQSTDDGQTWTEVSETGPVTQPVQLPDGRIAALTSEQLIVSSDQGATWKNESPALPMADNGFGTITYSAQQKAFFVTHYSCGSGNVPVPKDSILRYDFDYETR